MDQPGYINRSSIFKATEHLEDVVHPEQIGNISATQVSLITENVETRTENRNDSN